MIELRETSPFEGCTIPTGGSGFRITVIPCGHITAISPFPDQVEATRLRLGGFPATGEVIQLGDLRIVWTARDTAFVFGELPALDLWDICAVSDQSDGWAGIRFEGPGAEAFLSRRFPFDLSKLMPPGSARSLLGHLPILVVRPSLQCFELWCWRSMTASLCREIKM